MNREFRPVVRDPHLLTIAGNYWPRSIDESRFPAVRRTYQVDFDTCVVAFEHHTSGPERGQVLTLHGLEGSANAGYIASLAQTALTRGFGVHRLNMRTCGGTESLCKTMYHSGLTGDARFVIEQLRARGQGPIFVVGFSLGGNVALKLAGELGETDLLAGVVAVSTPIDLAESVRCLDKRCNLLYARRFLERLRSRVKRKSELSPEMYNAVGLDAVKTIWEFDDRFTAPLFGFGTAENYYNTQSARRFLHAIRIPTLVVVAKDDPLVPFESYHDENFQTNSALKLLATEHGGHLGFISRREPRFWADHVALDWFEDILRSETFRGTNTGSATSV